MGGCRILETGYGNPVTDGAADAVSGTLGAARSAVTWAGNEALSFGDALEPAHQRIFIAIGGHAASAYRNHPELPEGYKPMDAERFALLNLDPARYSYDPASGYLEDASGQGFGARIFESENDGGEIVIAFRGSNAPGEDESWMEDWIADAHQGGGGVPEQYLRGAETLQAARLAFPDSPITVTGHSLGGGIAAYSTLMLSETGKLLCATYNAAGISSITLMTMPKETVDARSEESIVNIRSKGDPVSAIPGTVLVGKTFEVDNLRFANHSIDGLLIDMKRRAEGRKAGWLRDLFDD